VKIDVATAAREHYDLCVIGAGPAGIIVALEFSKRTPIAKILLVEFGPEKTPLQNPLDNSIQVANPTNHHAPYECTNKGLGGSSESWGGRCVMYDEVDFLPRKILNGQCTWNVSLFHEVRRCADRAAEYFECGDARFNLEEIEIPEFAGSPIAENFRVGEVTDSVVERWSKPTRFGKTYRAKIMAAANIHLLTGWEVFSFGVGADNGGVSKIGIRDFSRAQTKTITARKVVIAAGAQEATRLLLKNPELFQNRGGVPPALGKFYQGHISGKIASVRFYGDPKKTEHGFLRDAAGIFLRRRFQLTTTALVENDLLNTAFWLDNPLYSDPAHRNGAMSFMYLAMITPGLGNRLAPPAIAQAFTKGKSAGIFPHLTNLVRDLPKSLAVPAAIFYARYCKDRKLPGVFLHSPRNVYALHFHAEQVPVAENRMELAPDGETLAIHYHYTDRDVDSVIRTHEFLDGWLRQCKCGELNYWHPKNELPGVIHTISKDGLHQVGTTRIAANATDGVVDEHLKVWGVPNLFVCSSSVFPTSGQANPTFFLGAFAARLAQHLAAEAN
jgi:choline dehydrogenase-like flavoprotein